IMVNAAAKVANIKKYFFIVGNIKCIKLVVCLVSLYKTYETPVLLHGTARIFRQTAAGNHAAAVCKYSRKIEKPQGAQCFFGTVPMPAVRCMRFVPLSCFVRSRTGPASDEKRLHPVEEQGPCNETGPFAYQHEHRGLFP